MVSSRRPTDATTEDERNRQVIDEDCLHSDVTRKLDTSCILNMPASKKFSAGRDDSGAMASNLGSGRPAFNVFFYKAAGNTLRVRQTLRSEIFG